MLRGELIPKMQKLKLTQTHSGYHYSFVWPCIRALHGKRCYFKGKINNTSLWKQRANWKANKKTKRTGSSKSSGRIPKHARSAISLRKYTRNNTQQQTTIHQKQQACSCLKCRCWMLSYYGLLQYQYPKICAQVFQTKVPGLVQCAHNIYYRLNVNIKVCNLGVLGYPVRTNTIMQGNHGGFSCILY